MADTGSSGIGVGAMVAIGLGVLTVVEYLLAVADVPGLLLLLAVIAVAKAYLIIVYFMHVRQLRRQT